jgi:hypothetical protein
VGTQSAEPSHITVSELRAEAARALRVRGNFGEVSQYLTKQDALADRRARGRRRFGVRSAQQLVENAFTRRGFRVDQDPSDVAGAPSRVEREFCQKFTRESPCPARPKDCTMADFVRVCTHVAVVGDDYFYTYLLDAARWERSEGQEAPLLADPRRDALIGEVFDAVDEAVP